MTNAISPYDASNFLKNSEQQATKIIAEIISTAVQPLKVVMCDVSLLIMQSHQHHSICVLNKTVPTAFLHIN